MFKDSASPFNRSEVLGSVAEEIGPEMGTTVEYQKEISGKGSGREDMSGVKSFKELRTSSCIKSFRSCRHSTAAPAQVLERGRMQAGEDRRTCYRVRQIWLKAGGKASGRSQVRYDSSQEF
jgi:hypothetical protein